MALYLVETFLDGISEEHLTDTIAQLTTKLDGTGELIEVQIGREAGRAFFIVETDDATALQTDVTAVGLDPLHVKEVLLVGDNLERIKQRRGEANYLVEWNLPAGLTMETYLARKEAKTPLYDEVPEVSFERTYVATDMSKCLCLYDSPDEGFVKQARAAVEAPIDALMTVKRVGPRR